MASPLIVVRNIVLPYADLDAEPRPSSGYLSLDAEIKAVLAVLSGIDAGGVPHLIKTDGSGNLILGNAGALIGQVRIQDGSGGGLAGVGTPSADADVESALSLRTLSVPYLLNGASWDRARGASAANLAAQSGLGVALASGPGEWSAVSNPATGSQATASRSAGGAGVRHVARSLTIAIGAAVAPVATAFTVFLRDGAAGVGTIIWAVNVVLPAQVVPTLWLSVPVNLVGSGATAMTLEFNAGLANVAESVALTGYDAS